MSLRERETAVRRILERGPAKVPPDLCAAAMRRGGRMLRRRTVARRLLWLALTGAVVAFFVWALTTQPWVEPPSTTTPPVVDW